MNLLTCATEGTWSKLSPLNDRTAPSAGDTAGQKLPHRPLAHTDLCLCRSLYLLNYVSSHRKIKKPKPTTKQNQAQRTSLWNHWDFSNLLFTRSKQRQLISLPPSDQKILVTVSTENSTRFLIIFAVLKRKYTDYMFTKNICMQIMASTAQSQLLPVPMYCLKCSQDWKKLWCHLIIN